MSQPDQPPPQKEHNKYLSNYTRPSTLHHAWRTAENSAAYLLPTLTQKASQTPNLTLLDIGAGSGTITSGLAKLMPSGQITALDISPVILSQASEHFAQEGVTNITTKVGSVYELPFPDESFDVVHVSQVLAHLDSPVQAISEMIRVTKKSGGVIGIRESDLRAWSFHPDESGGIQRFVEILCAVHKQNGGNNDAGKKLVGWCLQAGVKRKGIKASAGTWCYSSKEERELWGGVMVDRIANGRTMEIALKERIATEGEVGLVKEAWEKWILAEDGWFGCLHGEVVVSL